MRWKTILKLLGVGRDAPKTKLAKTFRWGERFIIVLCVIYVLLLVFPQPLFAYSFEKSGLSIYSQSPLPSAAVDAAIDRVISDIARSGFYSGKDSFRIFICNSHGLYRFFSPYFHQSFGISHPVTGNIFVAQADIERDRAHRFGKGFNERSFHSVVSHEITHALIRRKIGRFCEYHLPNWVKEGYCEYIAGESSFPENEGMHMILSGQQSNATAFQYFVWRKMVEYSIEGKGIPVDELLCSPPAALDEVKQEMVQWLSCKKENIVSPSE